MRSNMEKDKPTPRSADQQLFDGLEEAPVDLSDLSWEDTIPFTFFWALAFVVFLQFYTRYFVNNSLAWTEEIARYLLICVAFAGSVMAMRKRSHIAVEALHVFLPKSISRWTLVFVDGVTAAFSIYLAETSARLALRATGYMVSVDIPKSYLYWIVCVSFAGMAVYAIRNFYLRIKNPKDTVVSTAVMD
jgi:TRAP-type C4-dicarboxylate transport system permease small subunit